MPGNDTTSAQTKKARVAPYRHDPYHGLSHLEAGSLGECRDLPCAIAAAEARLGCVPEGRLRRLVFLLVGAALLQRVRDDAGIPLHVAKGGLVLQSLCGAGARPTNDLDGLIRCEPEDFLERARDALREPYGPLAAHIEEVELCQGEKAPFDALGFRLVLCADGAELERLPVDITSNVRPAAGDVFRYEPASLAALGLPTPDGLWGLRPERMLAEKVACCCEPHDPDGLDGVRPPRPNRHGKHLVDLIALIRLSEEGAIDPVGAMGETLRLVDLLDAQRASRGFLPYGRPLEIAALDHWRGEYLASALRAGLVLTMDDAVAEANAWLARER